MITTKITITPTLLELIIYKYTCNSNNKNDNNNNIIIKQ